LPSGRAKRPLGTIVGMSIPVYFSLLLLAPVVEETVFRAGLQQPLMRAGMAPRRASVVTALAFVAAHGMARSWVLAAAVTLPALGLAWLYQRSGSLVPCIAAHAGLNACWLGIAHLLDHASSPLLLQGLTS
jgi:membrane protease YdiL (CAAX protease family)